MVAIKTSQVNAFVARPDPKIRCILIYGTDDGLVREQANKLAQHFSQDQAEAGEILRLDDDDLDLAPERPIVELKTVAMFGGAKTIRVSAGPKLRDDVIATLVDDERLEGYFIVEAGNLKRDAKLRKKFETSPRAAALPCYPDQDDTLARMVREVLHGHELEIAPADLQELIAHLGADRGLSRSEVEKLALYCHGRHWVSADDIAAIVGDAAESGLERAARAILSGNAGPALDELDRSFAGGQSAHAILAALQRHLHQLHHVVVSAQSGATFEGAIKALRPPVHFSQRDILLAQCRRWTVAKLDQAQVLTRRAIHETRRKPDLEDTIAATLAIRLARMASRRH